jgi:hypothetical protein
VRIPPYTFCPGCATVAAPLSVMWEGEDPDTITWDGQVTVVCGQCSHIYDIERADVIPARASFVCRACGILSPCPPAASLVRCLGCGSLLVADA